MMKFLRLWNLPKKLNSLEPGHMVQIETDPGREFVIMRSDDFDRLLKDAAAMMTPIEEMNR